MKVSITYCAKWNYLPRASSLEDEIRKELGLDVELVAGDGGVYEVKADNREIFSKSQAGRFPERGEIVYLLKAL